MKIKCLPTDFLVEEFVDLEINRAGDYAVYRIRKKSITTARVIKYFSNWINKSPGLFSYAGNKDRHALTTQHITLKGDGPEIIETEFFSAKRLGYSDFPVKPKHLLKNSFSIVLRDLTKTELDRLIKNIPVVIKNGLPNYFDDQRFRSQRAPQNAFGFYLFRREYETALKIYVEEVLPYGKKINKTVQEQIFLNWGNWGEILRLDIHTSLSSSFYHLKSQPNDYQGALFHLDIFDLRMMVAAAQSYIWNEMLIRYLKKEISNPLKSVKGAWQNYGFYDMVPPSLQEKLSGRLFQMPNSKWSSSLPELKNILQKILIRHKLQLKDLELPGIKNIYLSEHNRRILVFPEKFSNTSPEKDDIYPGKYKLSLFFDLPPGSYATIVVKRLNCEF